MKKNTAWGKGLGGANWRGVIGAAACSAALLAATPAAAYEFGLSYVPLKVKTPEGNFEPELLRATLSQEVHRYLDAELMLGAKLQDAPVSGGAGQVQGEVQYHAGFYLKPKIQLAPRVQVFARVGYGRTKLAVEEGAQAKSDLGYGLGTSIGLSSNTAVVLDVMRYHDKDNISVRGASLGLSFRF